MLVMTEARTGADKLPISNYRQVHDKDKIR